MRQPKEKTFFVLEVDKKNKNHRIYTKSLVEGWLKNPKLKEEGFDIENGCEDIELDYEFIHEPLSCGVVTNLFFEGNKLYADCKFKIEGDASEKINSEEDFLEKIALVPKGKGAIRNQVVQDDYELYGFMIILKEESPFIEEELLKSETL
jgi:hypothetical protein